MTTKTSTKKAPAAKPAKTKGPSKAKMAELEARITAETEAEQARIAAEQAQPEPTPAPAIKADGRNRPETWVLSSTPKPTKKVWVVAEEMPGASRKEVIAECIKRGIAPGTSRTQYQAWLKATRDSKPA
jgi:hypothetical protein